MEPIDPSGPPVAVKGSSIMEILVIGAAAGYFLLVVLAMIRPTRGATHSVQVQWRERQQIAAEAAQRAGLQVPSADNK